MANLKSAVKRIRTTNRNRSRNKATKSGLKTYLNKAIDAIATNKEKALDFIKEAVSKIDRASAKGILHKKTAARKKSRLLKKFNKSK